MGRNEMEMRNLYFAKVNAASRPSRNREFIRAQKRSVT